MVRITMIDVICCILQLLSAYCQYSAVKLMNLSTEKEIRKSVMYEILCLMIKLTKRDSNAIAHT